MGDSWWSHPDAGVGQIAIGPGKADLLEQIDRLGSISAAGRALGISYRRTRDMIDTVNMCWATPLIETMKGGAGHGGARLTPTGKSVLTNYRALEAELDEVMKNHMQALFPLLRSHNSPK